MGQEIVVQADNITKIYKLFKKPEDRLKEAFVFWGNTEYHTEHFALNKVSFSVARGETIGIIGKNGSGKSTLLKILAGVIAPSFGKAQVKGKVTSLLELGAGFKPEYSGIENIYLNGTIMGYNKAEMNKKLNDILRFADIGDYIHQQVKTYSSGMFARLAFSVMVHLEPDILIVDEALSVGDTFFQQKCNKFMKNEMKNTTKLLVTHDMNSIASLADRCIVLDKGHVVFEGDPLESIEHYIKSMHTKSFEPAANSDNSSMMKRKAGSYIAEDIDETWQIIDQEKLGGALEARFQRFEVNINKQEYKGFVQSGDLVSINFSIEALRNIEKVIIGYIINDKYGKSIFGENSITSGFQSIKLSNEKKNMIKVDFYWPEIKEGDYFLTIGIGEGEHALQHVIQCWAHNIFKFESISPKKTIHCLFNNKIDNISVN